MSFKVAENAENVENAAVRCGGEDSRESSRLMKTFVAYFKILIVVKIVLWCVILYLYFSTPSCEAEMGRVAEILTAVAQTDGGRA